MHKRKKMIAVPALICPQSLSRRLLKHLLPVALLFMCCVALFALGFVAFSEKIYRMQQPAVMEKADGIIVLTGGRARLETGLRLLESGKGRRLLISGVNPVAGRHILMRATHADPYFFECCVDLGRQALNTIGNAEESADWVAKNGYRRVFVVTNSYHMPRSLSELRRKMPQTELVPYPVEPNNAGDASLLQFFERLRVFMIEYIKFLGVTARNIVL